VIWLAWRRHRQSLIVMTGVFILLAIWLVWVAHTFEASSPTSAGSGGVGDLLRCNHVPGGCLNNQTQASYIATILLLIPCLLGVALGAPLVATELQQHSNRLVWTQSISRSRWFIVKLSLVGLTSAGAVAILQPLVQWWSSHSSQGAFLVARGDLIAPFLFDVTGIVPIAYTLFAVSLGAAIGAVFRRTGWAVFGTVLVYLATAIVFPLEIRPRLAPQKFLPTPGPGGPSLSPQAWNLGQGFRLFPMTNRPGAVATANEIAQRCQDRNYVDPAYYHCLAIHGVKSGTIYEPASHYWVLQWREAAIFVGLAIILFGVALWAVRRWRA
jgi:hypothetical protein